MRLSEVLCCAELCHVRGVMSLALERGRGAVQTSCVCERRGSCLCSAKQNEMYSANMPQEKSPSAPATGQEEKIHHFFG